MLGDRYYKGGSSKGERSLVADFSFTLFDYVSANGQSKAGAGTLSREVRREELVEVLVLDSRAVVVEHDVVISVSGAVTQADHHATLHRLITSIGSFLLVYLDGLDRICDEVDEYSYQLRLRGHYIRFFHAQI